MSEQTAMTVQAATGHLTVEQIIERREVVEDLLRRAMAPGIDYGAIPGGSGKSKPTLLKPGAEKLERMFCLANRYETTKTFSSDGHLLVESKCFISDRDGNPISEASAICSTREARYAWRKAERECPVCHKPAIIKGKAEYGGGWLCFKKKDGCGTTFVDTDVRILNQQTGRVQNPDLADSYHSVTRIAEKRAYVAAVKIATGTSGLFDEEIPAENERADIPEGDASAAPAAPILATPERVKEIRTLLAELRLDEKTMVAWAGKGKQMAEELKADEAAKLLDHLHTEKGAITAFEAWTKQYLPGGSPDLATLNAALGHLAQLAPTPKALAWASIKDYAADRKWVFNDQAKVFVEP